MSSSRLPFVLLLESTLRNLNRVTVWPAGTRYSPVYVGTVSAAGWRGDDRAVGAGLVAEPVDADAGRLLGGLVSGRADHDAHPVEIVLV